MRKSSRKQITATEALVRLETLCAASEQCTFDLLRKLRIWGISSQDTEQIIDSLLERRFVDDTRFAEAYARDKMRFSRWGRNKIKLGLMTKRIASVIIREAVSKLNGEEYSTICRDLLRAKVRSGNIPCDYDGRTQLFRFGISRGYESELLSTIIRMGEPWSEDSDI